MSNDTIGAGVSKHHLDACRMSDGANRRFVKGRSHRLHEMGRAEAESP